MTATLTAPARKCKSAPSAARSTRPKPAAKPAADPVSNIALWRALAECPFNTAALAIVAAGEELLARVEAFLAEHSANGLVKGLRAAGLAGHANDHHRATGENVMDDLGGLEWSLSVGLSLISSELYPSPDSVLDEAESAELQQSR